MTDIRNEMVELMERRGIQIELHHHEVATAGQGEIDMRFDTLTKMGDKAMLYKYIVKNVAKRNGKVATFMPKPLFRTTARACTPTSPSGATARTSSPATSTPASAKMCLHYIAGSSSTAAR
jgi:glutamine synthetase